MGKRKKHDGKRLILGRFVRTAPVWDNSREEYFTPKQKAPQPLRLRPEYFDNSHKVS